MATIERALEIAITAHKGQKDKSGADYIFHAIRVMQKGETEIEKICGVLQDVIEDSNWTFEDLINEGFSEEVISVIRCLTKKSETEDYDIFIERVKTNPTAIKVKLNDLSDNMDITRLKELSEKDLKRLNKYLKVYRELKNR
jgi:(p)ppGpp synthase/HD superfamily hydrolase